MIKEQAYQETISAFKLGCDSQHVYHQSSQNEHFQDKNTSMSRLTNNDRPPIAQVIKPPSSSLRQNEASQTRVEQTSKVYDRSYSARRRTFKERKLTSRASLKPDQKADDNYEKSGTLDSAQVDHLITLEQVV